MAYHDTLCTVEAVGNGAQLQYDQAAKNILARRSILSHILSSTVTELCGMNPAQIEPLIEGDIHVSSVPVDAGFTNTTDGERVRLRGTEDGALLEGLILYDIIFYVRTGDGVTQIIINVEAQKEEPHGYDILNRAIFYACRMISSQKERDFVKQNYNDLKQVYSIWICMNSETSIISHAYLTMDSTPTKCSWRGRLDLINIILLGIPNELPENNEQHKLHRLLSVLFSRNMAADDRVELLKNEYHLGNEEDLKEVSKMCNLSQGILEQGIERGIERGIEQGIERGHINTLQQNIRNLMETMNWTAEFAMDSLKVSEGDRKILMERLG